VAKNNNDAQNVKITIEEPLTPCRNIIAVVSADKDFGVSVKPKQRSHRRLVPADGVIIVLGSRIYRTASATGVGRS